MTGASDRLDVQAAGSRVHALKALATVPVVAGFGIKDAASASAMARDADGVVVGSALVSALDGSGDADEAASRASGFLCPLREALDGGAALA